jgi:hypothetical protein
VQQLGGTASVGNGAETVKCGSSGVDFDSAAFFVAEHPLSPADHKPSGGFLVRQLEFPPTVQRTSKLIQRRRWTFRGEVVRALGHGRGRCYHRTVEAVRDRHQL